MKQKSTQWIEREFRIDVLIDMTEDILNADMKDEGQILWLSDVSLAESYPDYLKLLEAWTKGHRYAHPKMPNDINDEYYYIKDGNIHTLPMQWIQAYVIEVLKNYDKQVIDWVNSHKFFHGLEPIEY